MHGAAPDAQVLVMKVFGDEGGAYDSDYTAAIEDAIVLGADTINLSLGSASPGPSKARTEAYQKIFDDLENASSVVTVSSGTPAIGPRTLIRSAIFTATASACRRTASRAAMQTA